jgi:hypothetical protein
MGKHLRKLFSVDHAKEVFRRYLSREIAVDQASAMLKIRRRQFFKLLKLYRFSYNLIPVIAKLKRAASLDTFTIICSRRISWTARRNT